jgi:CelD/BcsL family acetyltransferase involved in cellulose biosynthesis
VLRVDDRPVAYHLGFEVDGRFTWYKPSFDVDYWDCGAGEVLLRRLFEYVRGQPVDEFDFTRGGEGFKDRFTNHQGHNVRWTLHGSALSARVAQWRSDARAALKRNPHITAWRAKLRRTDDTAPNGALHGGMVRFEASRQSLLAAVDESALPVRRGTLRDLALASVAADALVVPAALQSARERLSRGERLYVAQDGERLCGIGWLVAPDDELARLELLASPRAGASTLHALVLTMARDAGVPGLQLHCARADTELQAVLTRTGWRVQGAG